MTAPNRKSLADQIEDGTVSVCCLLEANLFAAEKMGPGESVRRCRACHRRHFRMKADPIVINARSLFGVPRPAPRQYRMRAEAGHVGARIR